MSSWRTATFSSRPAIDAKFANDMASKETLEQVKNLLKQELSPINSKLDGLTTKLSDIDTAVNFLSGKYDALLNQLKDTNRMKFKQACGKSRETLNF